MPNKEVPRGHVAVRACLEMPDGSYRSWKGFTEAETAQAIQVVGRDIKKALHGLAPLFGKAVLLSMCAEILEEDYDPAGPQTL